MKLLNKHQIPQWVVNKLCPTPRRPKKPERMSTTDLIKPPRMRTLFIERFDDIEEDVSGLFNFFDGNNLDAAFEKDIESQLKFELPIDGKILVGVLDRVEIEDGKKYIIDLKKCKTGQLHYPDSLLEWEKQLNIYSYLWKHFQGETVDGLYNAMFFKEWSAEVVKKDYPKIAWHRLDQPHWSFEKQEQYIKDQLEYHARAPYDCPEEERWSSFAVKTKGQKNANRVLKTRQACEDWMKETGRGEYIEDRVGRKCKFYCGVKSVCKHSPCCIEKWRTECK